MMDERIKSTYEKIYAELFRLILFVCCISVVVKTTVFHMSSLECIPEFPIMLVSPIYILIRGRMLGVTQAMPPAEKFKRNLQISLVCALVLSVFVFAAVTRSHGEDVSWTSLAQYAISFIVCYLLAHIGFRKWSEHQQKKLDDKYDE